MTGTIGTDKLYPQSFKKNSKRMKLVNFKSFMLLQKKKKRGC